MVTDTDITPFTKYHWIAVYLPSDNIFDGSQLWFSPVTLFSDGRSVTTGHWFCLQGKKLSVKRLPFPTRVLCVWVETSKITVLWNLSPNTVAWKDLRKFSSPLVLDHSLLLKALNWELFYGGSIVQRSF